MARAGTPRRATGWGSGGGAICAYGDSLRFADEVLLLRGGRSRTIDAYPWSRHGSSPRYELCFITEVTNGFGATGDPQRLRMGRSRAQGSRAVQPGGRIRKGRFIRPTVRFLFTSQIYSRLSIERTADESTCMLLVRLEAGLQARSGRSARRLPKHRRRPGADAALRGLGGAETAHDESGASRARRRGDDVARRFCLRPISDLEVFSFFSPELAPQRLRVTQSGSNAGRPAVPRPYSPKGVAASRLHGASARMHFSNETELVLVVFFCDVRRGHGGHRTRTAACA